DPQLGGDHGDVVRCPGKQSRIGQVLNQGHGAEPEPMTGALGIIQWIDVGISVWVLMDRVWSLDLDKLPACRRTAGVIAAVTAGRLVGALNIAERIPPDSKRVVDVLFPEALIGITNVAIGLCMVIGAGGHVGGNGRVVKDVARPQLRGEWVRAALNPAQNGLVVD